MPREPGGVRRWTERFTVASAAGLVASLLAAGAVPNGQAPVVLALFGFVCPMIFGMAAVLLPPYLGRTLIDHRPPALQFALAFGGAALLALGSLPRASSAMFAAGAAAWALGVAVLLGTLLATAVAARGEPNRRTGEVGPRPAPRVAPRAIPVALGYLALGSLALLGAADLPVFVDAASLQVLAELPLASALHLHAAGFGALLVVALGARLLPGFYRVALPPTLVHGVLVAAAVAPAPLALAPWRAPWFPVAAALLAAAMLGYLALVALVALRSARRRVPLLGVLLGAVAGAVAVLAAAPLALGGPALPHPLALHRTAVLWGFFPLTIVGYAYLFFPVTEGQFPGATRRGAATTIALLAVGLAVRLVGVAIALPSLRSAGVAASLLGALGYLYLVARRFAG